MPFVPFKVDCWWVWEKYCVFTTWVKRSYCVRVKTRYVLYACFFVTITTRISQHTSLQFKRRVTASMSVMCRNLFILSSTNAVRISCMYLQMKLCPDGSLAFLYWIMIRWPDRINLATFLSLVCHHKFLMILKMIQQAPS